MLVFRVEELSLQAIALVLMRKGFIVYRSVGLEIEVLNRVLHFTHAMTTFYKRAGLGATFETSRRLGLNSRSAFFESSMKSSVSCVATTVIHESPRIRGFRRSIVHRAASKSH